MLRRVPTFATLALLSGLVSACRTAAPSEALSDSAPDGSDSCQFAERIWNNVYGSRFVGGVAALPPLQGEAHTAFEIFKDPAIAVRTFLPSQNALGGEEVPRDEDGKPTRTKAIHSRGVVARIAFVRDPAADSPYTGLFATGARCGLIRVSLAVRPTADGVTPGAALKFYVDRADAATPRSVNLHVMNRLDPIPGYNPFAVPYANVLPAPVAPKLVAGAGYFRAALGVLGAHDRNPGHLTVEHLATVTSAGTPVAQPVAPYRVTFAPTAAAQGIMALADSHADFRIELRRIPAGTTLFDVHADDTADPGGAVGIKIGQIVLQTEFVASRYGDEILHFMHHTAGVN